MLKQQSQFLVQWSPAPHHTILPSSESMCHGEKEVSRWWKFRGQRAAGMNSGWAMFTSKATYTTRRPQSNHLGFLPILVLRHCFDGWFSERPHCKGARTRDLQRWAHFLDIYVATGHTRTVFPYGTQHSGSSSTPWSINVKSHNQQFSITLMIKKKSFKNFSGSEHEIKKTS